MSNMENHSETVEFGIDVSKSASSFKNRIASYAFTNQSHLDFKPFFESASILFKKTTKEVILTSHNVKVFAVLVAKFWRTHVTIAEKTNE